MARFPPETMRPETKKFVIFFVVFAFLGQQIANLIQNEAEVELFLSPPQQKVHIQGSSSRILFNTQFFFAFLGVSWVSFALFLHFFVAFFFEGHSGAHTRRIWGPCNGHFDFFLKIVGPFGHVEVDDSRKCPNEPLPQLCKWTSCRGEIQHGEIQRGVLGHLLWNLEHPSCQSSNFYHRVLGHQSILIKFLITWFWVTGVAIFKIPLCIFPRQLCV